MKLTISKLRQMIDEAYRDEKIDDRPSPGRVGVNEDEMSSDEFVYDVLRDRAVKAFIESGHNPNDGDQFSDDIFRHYAEDDVVAFNDADYEQASAIVAKENGFDVEGFIYFVSVALEAELERLEDEDV